MADLEETFGLRIPEKELRNFPKEKMNYTIDLLITMVTDEIAEETGKDRKDILTDFLCSKTGKALYD